MGGVTKTLFVLIFVGRKIGPWTPFGRIWGHLGPTEGPLRFALVSFVLRFPVSAPTFNQFWSEVTFFGKLCPISKKTLRFGNRGAFKINAFA